MPFRTFLFDLDGTLIDHFTAIYRAHAHTRAALGRPRPTPAEVRSAVGGGVEDALARLNPGADPAEALRIYLPYWEANLLDEVVLMPGARELLEGLRAGGAALAVLSNKPGPASRRVCDHLGIAPLLRAVVGAGDTEWLKPEPKLTAHVLNLIGAGGEGALLVGDSPYDVETARNAGLPSWCVTTGTHTAEQLRAAGADRVFPDLPGIARALKLPRPPA